jgi:hypothetical protein
VAVQRVTPGEVSHSCLRFLKFLLHFRNDRLHWKVLIIDEDEEQESHLRIPFQKHSPDKTESEDEKRRHKPMRFPN